MGLLGFRRHPVSEEGLSAYLDRRVSTRERERVETHLQSCPNCGRKLKEMKEIVAELSRLPQATAPRSFALSPEMAAVSRREAKVAVEEERTAARRVYLGLSGATVAAAILLFAVVSTDLLVSRGGGGQGSATATLSSSREAASPMAQGTTQADQDFKAIEPGAAGAAPGAPPPPASAVPEENAFSPSGTPVAALPSYQGAAAPQEPQSAAKEGSHLWLWILEGAAGGLIVGFGVSAFWVRRRWIQIDHD